jgi:hypothetical protein
MYEHKECLLYPLALIRVPGVILPVEKVEQLHKVGT